MMWGQAKRSITRNKKGKCLFGFRVICTAEKRKKNTETNDNIEKKKNLPTFYKHCII